MGDHSPLWGRSPKTCHRSGTHFSIFFIFQFSTPALLGLRCSVLAPQGTAERLCPHPLSLRIKKAKQRVSKGRGGGQAVSRIIDFPKGKQHFATVSKKASSTAPSMLLYGSSRVHLPGTQMSSIIFLLRKWSESVSPGSAARLTIKSLADCGRPLPTVGKIPENLPQVRDAFFHFLHFPIFDPGAPGAPLLSSGTTGDSRKILPPPLSLRIKNQNRGFPKGEGGGAGCTQNH